MNIPKVFIKYSSHLAQNRMINVNNIISISTETDLRENEFAICFSTIAGNEKWFYDNSARFNADLNFIERMIINTYHEN
jgi:hypothetical protein